jgi:putative hydrolase of the HAD superfamily
MTAILLDFFGTLVSYSPSRTGQGYPQTYDFVRSLGSALSYPAFLAAVVDCFTDFDRRSDVDDREFSMAATAEAFLAGQALDGSAAEFERRYLAEWSAGVVVPPGVPALLTSLRTRHRLAVVSNTHSPTMVPELLASMGVAKLFDAVVLSVDVGWRKPHPRIYTTALDALGGVPAAAAVFVGDSYLADYAGPAAVGIPAFLIDPAGTARIPAERRLASLFDLPDALS